MPPPPLLSLEWSGVVVYVILIPFHSILRQNEQNVEFTQVLCSRFTFWQRRERTTTRREIEGEREREREHFQFVIRRFPKKKRGKEKEYFIFAASLGTTL